MTVSLQLQVPSKDQIVAAIYETVLRQELSDRFCPQQKIDPLGPRPAASGRIGPVFQAPELQAHFARAVEILEQQWHQMGCPDPVLLLRGTAAQGRHDHSDTTDEQWILLDQTEDMLAASKTVHETLRAHTAGPQKIRSWLQLTQHSTLQWQEMFQTIASQQFSWHDIWVLETTSTHKKLLCRPVWSGGSEGTPAPVAIMIEVIDLAWMTGAEDLIALTFGLDAKESAILWGFLRGRRGSTNCSNDLQSVAAKAGAPGGAELIRLVCLLLSEQASDLAIRDGHILPPSFLIPNADGGSTQCFRMGAETGQPVIFIHGMMDGIAGIQRMQPLLRTSGFRIYAPMRRGYGASEPAPETHENLLRTCVAQIEALIDQENLQRPILLGHRSGTVYARAAALRLRDRIGGVLGVAPTPPLKDPSDYGTLRGHQRGLALCARFAPVMLPYVLKSWSRSIRRRGAGTLVRRQTEPGSKAMLLINQMSLDPVLSLSQALMMQQGGKGFLADLLLTTSDWRNQLAGRAGPTIYLCGDKQTALRQDGLFSGAMGMEQMQIRICGDVGNVLLYTGPELIISALEELSARHDENQAFTGFSTL